MSAPSRLTSPARLIVVALVAFLLGTGALGTPAAQAQAQVVGTADFRNAPQLAPGEYLDRIVTGDSAWYSVVYTNSTPYEFAVEFAGPAPDGGFDLNVSFVAPTLTTVDGPAPVVDGDGVDYPSGHTNEWFLKVSLDTGDQVGVEYPITISVAGVRSESLEDCGDIPGCVLDQEYAAVNVALAEATAEFEQAQSRESLDAVQSEIDNQLRGFAESTAALAPAAEARLARAEATMAELCAPDAMCDEFPEPQSRTPWTGWIIGVGALGFGGYRAFKKLTSETEEPPTEHREPTALERAKADQKAARAAARAR